MVSPQGGAITVPQPAAQSKPASVKRLLGGSEPTPTVTGQQPAYATETPDESSSQGGPNARGRNPKCSPPICAMMCATTSTEATRMNPDNPASASAPEEAPAIIGQSITHWNDPRRNRHPGGKRISKDFDQRRVRDTFYGRLLGLLNRIRRTLRLR